MRRVLRGCHATFVLLLLRVSTIALLSAEPETGRGIELRGIVSINDSVVPPLEIAVIQILEGKRIRLPMLKAGERDGTLEILSIQAKAGEVSIRDWSTQETSVLRFVEPRLETTEAPAIELRSVPNSILFDLLQTASGRTIIAPATCLGGSTDLTIPAVHSMREAAMGLEQALVSRHLLLEQRSDKFTLVARDSDLAILASIADPPHPEPPPKAEAPAKDGATSAARRRANEIFPPGLLKFQDTDSVQVLDVYQDLSGRTVIRDNSRSSKVTVRSQTPLTRPEAIWLLDATLRLADIVIVPESDKFVFAVPPSQTNALLRFSPPPAKQQSGSEEILPPGLLKFTQADLANVLDVYQAISGRSVIRGNVFMKVSVRTQTPLTPYEARWLLDAVIGVGHVAMVPESDKFVFAIPPALTNDLPRLDRRAALAKAAKAVDWTAGTLNLDDSSVQLLLDLYASALGREPLSSPVNLPNERLRFHSQTPLDQAETIYALEALAWIRNLTFQLIPPNLVTMLPVTKP